MTGGTARTAFSADDSYLLKAAFAPYARFQAASFNYGTRGFIAVCATAYSTTNFSLRSGLFALTADFQDFAANFSTRFPERKKEGTALFSRGGEAKGALIIRTATAIATSAAAALDFPTSIFIGKEGLLTLAATATAKITGEKVPGKGRDGEGKGAAKNLAPRAAEARGSPFNLAYAGTLAFFAGRSGLAAAQGGTKKLL